MARKPRPKLPDLTLVFLADELVHMQEAQEYQHALDIVNALQTHLALLEQDIIRQLSQEP